MSDDATNCLVYSSGRLQLVPLLTVKLKIWLLFFLQIKILLFLEHSWVIHTWIWDSNNKNSSRSIINEVKTFRELSATHTGQQCPFTSVDSFQVLFEDLLEVFSSFCLAEDLPLKLYLLVIPLLHRILHHLIRRKEDEDTAWNQHLHLLDKHAE